MKFLMLLLCTITEERSVTLRDGQTNSDNSTKKKIKKKCMKNKVIVFNLHPGSRLSKYFIMYCISMCWLYIYQ